MPSVDSLNLIKEMLENNGHYLDDPQAKQISQYTNNWGGITYHLAYNDNEILNLYNSPFCHNIIPLWRRGYGLTSAGELKLQEKQ